MEVTLILIGKTCQGYLLEGEGVYNGKLKHYTKFSEEVITLKKGKQKDKTSLKKTEGKKF